MTQAMRGMRAVAAAVLVGLALAVGCREESVGTNPTPGTGSNTTQPTTTSTTGPATGPAGEAADSASRARPGYAVGRVLGPDGKPITAPGSRVAITIKGVSRVTNDAVTYYPEVRPDGTYEQKLDDGTYRSISGVVELPYDGLQFRFPLVPVQEQDGFVDAKKPIVQDFAWKLSGAKPGQRPDPTRPAVWHGGAVSVLFKGFRQDLKRSVPAAPKGTKVVVTLTPTSTLVGGYAGKPIVAERSYDGSMGLDNNVVPGVPPGNYKVSAVEILPDGKQNKLLFLGEDGQTWQESVAGGFKPNLEKATVEQAVVFFTRPVE